MSLKNLSKKKNERAFFVKRCLHPEVGFYKRKQESKKTRTRPRKRSRKQERKQELDQENDQEKKENTLFFS